MSEKAYEFRELCSKDMFPMFKIINKIGFKEFKNCFQSDDVKQMIANAGKGEAGKESIGLSIVFDIAGVILQNLPACEDDIFTMLSSVSNMTKKDVEKMSMGDFAEMIVDFIKKPEFADFIRVVSRLFK